MMFLMYIMGQRDCQLRQAHKLFGQLDCLTFESGFVFCGAR